MGSFKVLGTFGGPFRVFCVNFQTLCQQVIYLRFLKFSPFKNEINLEMEFLCSTLMSHFPRAVTTLSDV